MIKMEYKKRCQENIQILDEGIYNNFHYAIVSLGSHPCAYVELPKEHKWYGKYYDNIPIDCHGGLTYSSTQGIICPLNNPNHRDGYWIGWDYAHYGDYVYNDFNDFGFAYDFNDFGFAYDFNDFGFALGEKHWTTEEIFEDVKDVINQL